MPRHPCAQLAQGCPTWRGVCVVEKTDEFLRCALDQTVSDSFGHPALLQVDHRRDVHRLSLTDRRVHGELEWNASRK